MMYYKKKNTSYTDMCIWIDEHAHENDCNDEQLFEYLYLILVMLVRNNHDFKNEQQYNDFGIFGASYMYFRYLTKRRKYWEAKTDEERDGIKIKSCLNYVRSILPFLRIRFQDEVLGIYRPLAKEDEEEVQDQYLFSDTLSQIVDEIALCDFRLYLDDIPKTVRNYLQRIPKCKNSFEWDNIYISVMLTLINQMTLNEKIKNSVFECKQSRGRKINSEGIYAQMRENPVILYRVDKSLENYVLTLAREVKHLIAQDLSEMSDVYIPADNRMAIEIIQQLTGEEEDYGYDDARD